ncbi:olfactory receptor 142-like [Sigmodon hispidus]
MARTNVTELIITGLFQDPEVQKVCFVLFLPVYLATVLGNGLIVVTVGISKSLCSPMYIFLSSLSVVEICYSSTVVPKFITDLLTKVKTISLKGCLAQIFFFHFLGVAEILLLVVMAYDRYVAICKPLHYMNIMSLQVCHMLVAGSWLGGLIHSIIQILITIPLPFCGPNVIDHYFCDLQPLFKLACTDTFMEGVIVMANSGLISIISLLILVTSYAIILINLRNHSAEGRRKALSTCASHITVVILFFGPAIFLYLRPSSTFTEDKLVAVFYTVITPMLNPIIYTLRNAESTNEVEDDFTPSLLLGCRWLLAFLTPSSSIFSAFPSSAVYLATVLGNGLIVVTVGISKILRSPMYFFLSSLSLVEICYSSTIVPKFITDLLAKIKTISLKGCLAQIFFSHFFGVVEVILLVVMAYDRYVAICKPLHYMNIMSPQVCHMLVAGSWLGGLIHSIIQILITIPLPFCGPNVIDHYFCDLQPLFKLACTDTFMEGVIVMVNSGLISIISLLILVTSYAIILINLRNHSAEGRRKALSTCASHITVVILFFGPGAFIYMRPSSTFTVDKLVAVFYTVITPMLNPIVYTLRNAEMKNAIGKIWSRKEN